MQRRNSTSCRNRRKEFRSKKVRGLDPPVRRLHRDLSRAQLETPYVVSYNAEAPGVSLGQGLRLKNAQAVKLAGGIGNQITNRGGTVRDGEERLVSCYVNRRPGTRGKKDGEIGRESCRERV